LPVADGAKPHRFRMGEKRQTPSTDTPR
jgi:hypothetical protein